MAADIDEGFEPVPALNEPVDPADELALEDALADRDFVAAGAPEPTPLGRAPAYDFVNRRLLPGAAGGPLMTRGLDTLRTWVEKCARTRRGAHPAVDPGFGCDLIAEDLLEEGGPFDAALIAEYLAALERGLAAHPWIDGVENAEVSYDPDDDAVGLRFRVTFVGELDDETGLDFDMTLGA